MKSFCCLLFLLTYFTTFSQKCINKERVVSGTIELSEKINIPKLNPGYTLWLPENKKPIGLIVFTHCRRDTIQGNEFIQYALEQSLAVMYACTDNRLEFFFENTKMQEIESFIYETLSKHKIPSNLFYAGMSLEGTRALKLAIFSYSPYSIYHLKPKAIAVCDAPLDMIRFYNEMKKAIKLNYHPIGVNEATWVSAYLEKKLGNPLDQTNAYVAYSPYCYLANGGPNYNSLKEISIRCYTEPDVHWWMKNRGKDYYGMNAIDMAALINNLQLDGNSNAELVATENKGFLDDGSRHPHSWSIVDQQELIHWFLSHIE